MLNTVKKSDAELYDIICDELRRQEGNIEMIASESTVPVELLEISGSIFTNKTTEGYPGARFQAGSQYADKMEEMAIKRCKELYGAEHANIQPYSGSSANYAVYASILNPGDTVLAMSLDQGGHLTHGSPVNFMSKFFNFVSYGLNKNTEQIDYDELADKAHKHKPKLIISGGSSYPRLIDYEKISEIAKKVNAYTMVDMAHISGLVAAKVIKSPVPVSDFVSSSMAKTLCGPRGGFVLCGKGFEKALDKGVFPGSLSSIHLHTMAAKAYTFKYAQTDAFKNIMKQTVKNAAHLALCLEKRGFRIVSGGTDNHIVMVDLRPKGVTGKMLQDALEYVGITVNKNMIPFDTQAPSVTSGIRIGTTAVSQRGLKENEIEQIAAIIDTVSQNTGNTAVLDKCKNEATDLISAFPLYETGAVKY